MMLCLPADRSITEQQQPWHDQTISAGREESSLSVSRTLLVIRINRNWGQFLLDGKTFVSDFRAFIRPRVEVRRQRGRRILKIGSGYVFLIVCSDVINMREKRAKTDFFAYLVLSSSYHAKSRQKNKKCCYSSNDLPWALSDTENLMWIRAFSRPQWRHQHGIFAGFKVHLSVAADSEPRHVSVREFSCSGQCRCKCQGHNWRQWVNHSAVDW